MALQDENEAFYFIKNPNGKITVRITEKDDVYPGEIETGFFSLNKEEARGPDYRSKPHRQLSKPLANASGMIRTPSIDPNGTLLLWSQPQ